MRVMAAMSPPAAGRRMAVLINIQQINRGNLRPNYRDERISAKGGGLASRRTNAFVPIARRRRNGARADADPGMGVELLPACHPRRSDRGQSRHAAVVDFRS